MRLRDLLLQPVPTAYRWCRFISGFRAWGDRSQPRRGRCNLKLGNDWGANLQQGFGLPAAGSDLCAQTQPALDDNKGIDRYGVGIRVRDHRFSLATPAIESIQPRSVRHLILL